MRTVNTIITYHCDVCGLLKEERNLIRRPTKKMKTIYSMKKAIYDGDVHYDLTISEMDICDICHKKILEFIDSLRFEK